MNLIFKHINLIYQVRFFCTVSFIQKLYILLIYTNTLRNNERNYYYVQLHKI